MISISLGIFWFEAKPTLRTDIIICIFAIFRAADCSRNILSSLPLGSQTIATSIFVLLLWQMHSVASEYRKYLFHRSIWKYHMDRSVMPSNTFYCLWTTNSHSKKAVNIAAPICNTHTSSSKLMEIVHFTVEEVCIIETSYNIGLKTKRKMQNDVKILLTTSP